MRKIIGNKAEEDIVHIDDFEFNIEKFYCFYHKPSKTLCKLTKIFFIGNVLWSWVNISSSYSDLVANYWTGEDPKGLLSKTISNGVKVYEFDSIVEAVAWAYGDGK